MKQRSQRSRAQEHRTTRRTPANVTTILGCPVSLVGVSEVVALAENSDHRFVHLSLNASKVVMAAHNPTLKRALWGASTIGADGVSVWSKTKIRCTGVQVCDAMLERARDLGWKVAIVGATPEVVSRSAELLSDRGVDVVFYHHGFFRPSEERALVHCIQRSGAELLLVALGSPASELFLARWRPQVQVALVVGGTLDILVGNTKRAPAFVQNVGLEWAYRFLSEPKKRFTRAIIHSASFMVRRALESVRGSSREK